MSAQPIQLIHKWFQSNSWKPFDFQERSWKAILDKKHGIVNAPTGSGKTYSLLLPMLAEMARTPKRAFS